MLKIEYVDIDTIKPYENNAKLHPEEQVEQIKRSIQDYGMNDAIGVWHDEIVEGHGRYMACKQLGIKEIPIVRLDDLTDDQRKEYMLVHNKTTMNSDFDFDLLDIELEGLPEFDAEFYDFEIDTSSDYEEPEEDPFEDIEKLETHYGVPYQGNKSRIADRIISILPKGKRLVDLFGGGVEQLHIAPCSLANGRVIYTMT